MRNYFQWICTAALGSQLVLGASLFDDRVIAKGKGVEVKSSEVEDAFISFKANQAAAGQPVPKTPEEEKKVELEILDHLIASKLFIAHATEADRTNSAPIAEKFIKDKREGATSEASFKRQILALGLTIPQFEQQVREQALVKSVIDRELRSKQTVTDAEIEKFYNDNPTLFQEKEKWRVAHVHLANVEKVTLKPISVTDAERNQARIKELARRASGGEDFNKLAKEYSEDFLSKYEGGEYLVVKGQMPPEFEAAMLSLKVGQVSDVVTTRFGWHVIKLLEVIPTKTVDLASTKEKIRDAIIQQKTQKLLPDFVKQLRKDAGVELIGPPKS